MGCPRSLEKRPNSQRDLLLPDDKELQFTISNGTLLSGYAGMGAWHSLVTSQNLIPPGTQKNPRPEAVMDKAVARMANKAGSRAVI